MPETGMKTKYVVLTLKHSITGEDQSEGLTEKETSEPS